jgi:co-chaperonin GroES (HSP10)
MITKKFPVNPYGDQIIIERIHILDKVQKRAEKNKIILEKGAPPKNLMDIEKQAAEQISRYEESEGKLLARWDENPNQAIVMAVGPGRQITPDFVLIPKIKVGEHILIRGNSGEPLVINKKLYWVIRDNDIHGIVPAADLIK